MDKRQAKRWVNAWASDVLFGFMDCDTIVDGDDGTMRPIEDIERLQSAVRDLCAELNKRTQQQRLD